MLVISEKSKKLSEQNEVSFTCSDDALNTLTKVLRVCEYLGSVGSSREVSFGFDGDGSAKVSNVKIGNITLKEWLEHNNPDFEFNSRKEEIKV